ncbi:major facilitator superfamily domain-containing protein [Colletotrichum navitas]|uniref:Major facilitator superfamily domain-containing protein n=1 Tax=Colletotrichum navitas TaxID=681940 RepID=A0AAD8PYB8_9PEZI|nr:major facilitator superfamily domain-containing protein [Colletotrichum navitas]KAK1590261.1 major facilitator superfamily domain-containing protein [Colletotrichum navitas]
MTDLTTVEKSLQDQTNILPFKKRLVVSVTLAVTMLVTFIDQNGISVTLPTIAADLNAEDTISWAGTSSLVANTMFQMLYGRFSDIFGRKAIFLSAIALLSLADLLCGLSQSATMFYIFRGIAGIGGGGITNLAMIILSDIVTLEQRGNYQGITGSMVGLGSAIGPFLAAAFVEKTTWRAFFWMLSPMGLIVGIIAYYLLPFKPSEEDFMKGVKKIDYAGSLTSSAGVVLLLIPISGGGAYFPWNSATVISMLTIGAIFMAAFVFVEWKFARLPMMPVSIFKNKVVAVLLIQCFLLGAVYQSYLYYIPLYLQNAHQYSALQSAAITVSLMSTQTVLSVLSGQYISRVKRYGEVIWAGFGLWTLGAGLTLIYDSDTKPGIIVIPLIIIGMGVGLIFQPTLVALQAHSLRSRRAVITSNRNFFRCAGGACGLAVSAAVLQATLRAHLPPEFKYLSNSSYSIPKLNEQDMAVVLDSYMAASRAVFILQIPLIGLCLIGCLFVKDQGLHPIDDIEPTDSTTESRDEEGGVSREKSTRNNDGSIGEQMMASSARAQ